VKLRTTRKLLLRITNGARKELGLKLPERVGKESLEHEYWKRYYARHFQEKGYQVVVEAPRRHGRADLLAIKPAENEARAPETLAIEIETGKSDAIWNVKQDLLMGWRVVVVPTSEGVRRKLERELGREGLIGRAGAELMCCNCLF
jgi:hypothetical protein